MVVRNMYLKIKVEQVNTETDLFIMSNAKGKLALVSAMIYDEQGKALRGASVNKELIEFIAGLEIKLPNKKI